jgi:hypothetical protein
MENTTVALMTAEILPASAFVCCKMVYSLPTLPQKGAMQCPTEQLKPEEENKNVPSIS